MAERAIQNQKLEAALQYAAMGWRVFPLHSVSLDKGVAVCTCRKPACKNAGKHPIFSGGFKIATCGPDRIRSWWSDRPQANIGVVTGAESGIICIDIDPRNDGDKSFDECLRTLGDLPESATAFTGGGGKHLVFKHPGIAVKNSNSAVAPGIDVKGDGGYIVVEPSMHASGKEYVWVDHIVELNPVTIPDEWLEVILDPTSRNTTKGRSKRCGGYTLPRSIPEGVRNEELTSFAGSLRKKGLDKEAIAVLLLNANQSVCDPPLSDDEVRAIAESISKYPKGGSDKKKSPSQRLMSLFVDAEFFRSDDDSGEAFVSVMNNGHLETWPLRSSDFRLLAGERYHREYNTVIPQKSLQDALAALEGRAMFNGMKRQVAIRVAGDTESVYLDLVNNEWEVAEVTRSGWRILPASEIPVRFRRARGMSPLPMPQQGGTIDALREIVNVPEEKSWKLLCGWILQSLLPFGTYPILIVNGEHGSAKSCLSRIARSIVDPSTANLQRPPKSSRDLVIASKNGWICAFDNLSCLSSSLSDDLCSIATGMGFRARQLYTDTDEVVFKVRRPIIINGIEELASRPDLADRAVHLTLETIKPGQRRSEEEIWRRFHECWPVVLGAFLDASSTVLARRDEVQLDALPRMADFAQSVTAAESSFGWEDCSFIQDLEENRQETAATAFEATLIGQPLLQVLQHSPNWSGTWDELRRQTERHADLRAKSERGWPRSAKGMSNAVRRIVPVLRTVYGFDYASGKQGTGNDRKRIVRFHRIE